MSSPQPNPDDDRVQRSMRADQFYDARRNGPVADWEQYLAGMSGKTRLAVLIEMVLIDLDCGWDQGQRPVIEDYIARFPELGPIEQVSPKLILEEYRCRLKAGLPADLDGYRSRFPIQYDIIEPELESSGRPTIVPDSGRPGSGGSPSGPPSGPSSGRYEALQSVADQYEFVRELGRGMFGEVWLARKKTSGIEKAIKILLQPADRDVARRELRSLELIKNLRHPYLLATEDFWVANNRLHIVMELADGGTLRTRFKECRREMLPGIPEDELLGYFQEAAEGLDYLHAQKPAIVHRDVKPDNILLLHGHAKVADFGLAREQQAIMASMSFGGTPAYMAPEVWGGEGGPASDQYSLAFAYAELRQGKGPIPAKANMQEMMFAHLDGLFEFEPFVGETERDVLRKAMAKMPNERYPSCGAFIVELARAHGRSFLRKSGKVAVPGPRLAPTGDEPATLTAGSAFARTGTVQPEPKKSDPKKPEPVGQQMVGTHGVSGTVTDRPPSRLHAPLRPKPSAKPKLLLAIGATLGLVAAFGLVVYLLFFGGNGGSSEGTQDTGGSVTVSTGHGDTGTTKPTIKITNGGQNQRQPVVPQGARGVGPVRPLNDGREVFDWIEYTVGGEVVKFRLVAPIGPAESVPPPFYIMESKVWNRLYREGAKEKGLAVSPDRPELGGDDAPAFHVTAEEADAFARAVFPPGGRLPFPVEWDHAAGFHEQQNQNGPTKSGGKPRVQLNLPKPTHGLNARDDVNQFGLIDMAGNGTEWTRQVLMPGMAPKTIGLDVIAPGDRVILRGQRYLSADPLTYNRMNFEQTTPQTQFASSRTRFTTFRVVVPVP